MARSLTARHTLLAATLAALTACAAPDVPEQVERPADILYDEALELALNGDGKKAAPKFEEVERQHP